jgi:glycine betaine/proline transport system permease protein
MKFTKNTTTIITILSLTVILLANSYLIHLFKIESFTDFPIDISSPLEKSIDDSIGWVVINFGWFFDYISDNLKYLLGKMRTFLVWIPWPITMISVFLLAWKIASYKVGIMCVIGLSLLALVNLWEPTMVTVAIMIVAVLISIIIGVPLGILGSKSEVTDTVMRPILDAMQTMPSFVYLVPGIMLFGLGNVAAILATVLYAIPPCIRFTNLGIRQVDESLVEAGKSFGSSDIQLLTKIQIPMAIPTIMAGINQTVMMALAMSTIAAMVGAGGLGTEVLRAMGQLREGEAVVAGFAIVILAIIIDRISQGYIASKTI